MEAQQAYQQDFNRKFFRYQEKKIAVYGTGQNARLIAKYVMGYEIVGFISRDGTEGSLSGQVILSIEEAVRIADIILIAATVSSTNIIYSRIKEIVPSRIKILDLYGELLNGKEPYKENSYWEKSSSGLCLQMEQYAAVSFDVFDTLIMRRVLKPEDVFAILEDRYNGDNKKRELKKWRMDAERKYASKKQIPSFIDIYELLKNEHHLDEETVEKLKEWEMEQEKTCIIARDTMTEIYRYALSCGKKIYFTSDMYLSSEQIRELLGQCGIEEGYELLVSCELHASKQDGSLYEKLKEIAGDMRILHIGDHPVIDGIMAKKKGIDSFTILSAYDLLAASSFVCIFDSIQTENDRNYLGYFVSVMLNDPFALSKYSGKFRLSSYKDIALSIYPITMMFLTYIVENAQRYDCILFPSRDGFFLYELYNQIKKDKVGRKLPDAKYVYASRMALSRAAISDRESLMVLLDKLFSDRTINCRDYILNQFDIELPKEYDVSSGNLIEKWGKEEVIKKLEQYYPDIVKKTEKHKASYCEYLDSLGLDEYRSIALVDIVSYGTQVYCLSQILNQKIDMIALGTTDIPNVYVNDEERVFSVYGNINKKADGAIYSCSNLSAAHLMLEMLYASTDGQFMGISEDQMPIFQEQTKYNKKLITGVQRELVKIMKETEKFGFHYDHISKKFSVGMLQLLFRKYSDINKELKEQFVFSDPYRGEVKQINLTDML